MQAFVVIPCLNEEDCIAATCASLGFGDGLRPPERLVLVDNGSTDGTLAAMVEIQRASPSGCVLIRQEPRRGYVAARRAGMAAVLDVARQEGLAEDEVLVLQADADTIYLPGYAKFMADGHRGSRGQLTEASAVTSREFNREFPEFAQLCQEIDGEMERWFAPEEMQLVVDDKVCAFLLADYLAWGEHQDELDEQGRLVLAETTRLFIRAKAAARVWRHRVEGAKALPSRRRLRTQAPGYFACSGFPRQGRWMEGWGTPGEAQTFLRSPKSWPALSRLVLSRQRHQLALFCLLPAVYADDAQAHPGLAALAETIRGEPAALSPGRLLGRMLELASEENGALSTILRIG